MTQYASCKAELEKMIATLETETTELRQGDFRSLQAHANAKLEGMKQLNAAMAALESEAERKSLAPLMNRLQRLSSENGILLKSMYNGSKAAQARLESLRQADAKVGVYGRNGEQLSLTEGCSLNEKTV